MISYDKDMRYENHVFVFMALFCQYCSYDMTGYDNLGSDTLIPHSIQAYKKASLILRRCGISSIFVDSTSTMTNTSTKQQAQAPLEGRLRPILRIRIFHTLLSSKLVK